MRPAGLFAVVLCVALVTLEAVKRNWPLLIVLVVGPLVTAYITRHQARWFR
jgi:hypothetical protein